MQINWTRLLSNTNTVYMWNFYEVKSHKLQIAKVLITICLEMASKGAKEVMWPNLLLRSTKPFILGAESSTCLSFARVSVKLGLTKENIGRWPPTAETTATSPWSQKSGAGDTALICMVSGTGWGVPFPSLSPRGHRSLKEHSLQSQEDTFYILIHLFNLCVPCVFWVARMCGKGRGRRRCQNL